MNDQSIVDSLVQQFNAEGIRSMVVLGSYAREDAGPYSDIDLLRIIDENADVGSGGSYLIDDRLVNVSNADPAQVEAWFTEPNLAVTVVAALREAKILLDKEQTFASIQKRANSFIWDEEMQSKADKYASQEMVGWIEEVHKGLEGLRRLNLNLDADELAREVVGRLLNARFGCTFGLSHVVQVQKGIAINSDNAFYAELTQAIGRDSSWSRLRDLAFGVGRDGRVPTLQEQVEAGLLLYVETVNILGEAIQPEHKSLIERTVKRINDYW